VADTSDVVIVNTGDTLVPAATVTEAGTVTPELLLDRFTTVSAGAIPFMVTLLAVLAVLPMIDEGDRVTEAGVNGMSVIPFITTAPL